MFKSERQNEILKALSKDRFLSVSELAEKTYSSMPTVRRDLTALESAGLVKRCHGGVILYDGKENFPVFFRQGKCHAQKVRIAKAAATLIKEGDVIFIDSSSTALGIADHLPKNISLTVVTNGLLSIRRFADNGVTVYSTGGRLMTESYAFVGRSAETSLAKYNADLMFFSTASLSENGCVSDWSEEERDMRVAMTEHAAIKVLLCDSSKLGTSSAFKLFDVTSVDYLVTDSRLDGALLDKLSLYSSYGEDTFIYKTLRADPLEETE